MIEAETRYALTEDGVHIAYQIHGRGDADLVWISGFADNVEIAVDINPHWARMLSALAARWRVIRFDKRGTGLSDRTQSPDLEKRADDLRAVLDEAGSRSAALCGESEGGALGAFFAATYPRRVSALILLDAWARVAWAPDYEFGVTEEEFLADRAETERSWGTVAGAQAWVDAEVPSMSGDAEFVRQAAKEMRHAASPASAVEFMDAWYATDVRAILGSIQAPTMMISRSEAQGSVGEPGIVAAASRYMAERIPGAQHVHVPGRDLVPWLGDSQRIVSEIEAFLSRQREEQADLDRVLTTVLFTDVVGSTEAAADLGDHAWKSLLERHHQAVRALLGRYRGRELDTAGDGFYASFDGPARAVHCAQAIAAALPQVGVHVRSGVHTGEVELIDGKPGGMAVNIGARIAAKADGDEVLVSQTVKDLVVGSGLVFEERGDYELKGVPGRWHLYAAVP